MKSQNCAQTSQEHTTEEMPYCCGTRGDKRTDPSMKGEQRLKQENQQAQRTKQNITKTNQNTAGSREEVDDKNQQVQHTSGRTRRQNHRKAEHAARNTKADKRTLPKQCRNTCCEEKQETKGKQQIRKSAKSSAQTKHETEGEEQMKPAKQGQTRTSSLLFRETHKTLCALSLAFSCNLQFQILQWPQTNCDISTPTIFGALSGESQTSSPHPKPSYPKHPNRSKPRW